MFEISNLEIDFEDLFMIKLASRRYKDLTDFENLRKLNKK